MNSIIETLDADSDREAIKKALATHCDAVGRLLQDHLQREDLVYLVVNGSDFIEVGKPIAIAYEDKLAGIACLWPHLSNDRRLDGTRLFSLPDEFVETITTDSVEITLVVAQGFIADVNELILMIGRVLSDLPVVRILLVSAVASEGVVAALRKYFGSELVVNSIASINSVELDLYPMQQRMFAKLDDRPKKNGPRLSRWLLNRTHEPQHDDTLNGSPPFGG